MPNLDHAAKSPISTHAPARGATEIQLRGRHVLVDFYSRPCERGDLRVPGEDPRVERISTHAPARGATLRVDGDLPHRGRISTHAPARGATGRKAHPGKVPPDFYSRPCERGDGLLEYGPARRAYFYSRPCERGDRRPTRSRPAQANFYSRPCERGD